MCTVMHEHESQFHIMHLQNTMFSHTRWWKPFLVSTFFLRFQPLTCHVDNNDCGCFWRIQFDSRKHDFLFCHFWFYYILWLCVDRVDCGWLSRSPHLSLLFSLHSRRENSAVDSFLIWRSNIYFYGVRFCLVIAWNLEHIEKSYQRLFTLWFFIVFY